MGRIRTIKPEFPQSETVGRLSRDARLLFVLLWTLVDDEGKSRAASRMLASLLFPYDEDAPGLIDGWLAELECEGCIRRYEVEGSVYLEIVNWKKHQRIDKPSPSRLPKFSEASRVFANVREVSQTDMDLGPSTSTKEDLCTKPEETVSHPIVSKAEPEKAKRKSYPDDFEEFWKAYPTDPGMSKQEAHKAWEKLSPEDRLLAIEGIPGFKEWIRKQPSDYRIVHACRYLSQRRFDEFSSNGTAIFDTVNWSEDKWRSAIDVAKRRDRWPETYGPPSRIPAHLVDDELRAQARGQDGQTGHPSIRGCQLSGVPYTKAHHSRKVALRKASKMKKSKTPRGDPYWGKCPRCGGNDGCRSIYREHWYYCAQHKIKWCIGANLFSGWRELGEKGWRENFDYLYNFKDMSGRIKSGKPQFKCKDQLSEDECPF